MRPTFLVDTNVLSQPVRPRPHPHALRRLQAHEAQVATAGPVWHELVFGCFRLPPSTRREAIERYLFHVVQPAMAILPYDERAAEWHARERARLAALGRTPSFVDGQIAAIAAVNGLVVATLNAGDFRGFEGVGVEDWGRDVDEATSIEGTT